MRRRKSTQMLTEPDFLGTTTMPEHQGVGLSERDITPSDSICPSSSCTFFLKGIGTTRGVNKANGLASGARLILKLSGNVPRPVKIALSGSLVRSSIASTTVSMFSDWMAGRPKRFCCKFLTTYSLFLSDRPL